MFSNMDPNLIVMYVSLSSLLIALASFLAALKANSIARGSLSLARQVANRDRRDWQQRQWFDLYFQLNTAYDFFDEFQTKYKMTHPEAWALKSSRTGTA